MSTSSESGQHTLGDDTTDQPTGEISRVTVKAPPFWRANPALWFCQLEAQFENSRITIDKTKYFTVVAAIESSILNQVSDLVLNPPENDMYNTLKARLLSVFADSEQIRIKKLLGDVEITEKKPSSLLREMRTLAGNSLTPALLKTLWLQRLPVNIQSILSVSSEGIDGLVVIADKIFDTTAYELNTVNSTRPSEKSLEFQISELSLQVAELKACFSRRDEQFNRDRYSRTRSRSPTPYRRSNNHSESSPSKQGMCWYHIRWGEKANTCIGKCNYKRKTNSLN